MRANASKSIGAGHVMRLCAIAEELVLRGHEVSLCADYIELDWVRNYLSGIDFHKVVIHDSGLGEFETRSHIVVADSYVKDFLTNSLLNYTWRKRVLVWDSFTPVVDSEIYFVPSLDKPPVLGKSTNVLSGPEFIPLRCGIRKRDWSFTNSPKKLFVIAGGSDPFNLIPYLHGVFSELNLNLSITFVGAAVSSTSKSIRFIDFSENIDLLLNEADLVIATASTSSYEILARGIPLAIVQAADNQASNYSKLIASKLAVGLGIRIKDSHWEIDRELLVDFISGFEQKFDSRNTIQPPLDLNGSSRIATALEIAWEG